MKANRGLSRGVSKDRDMAGGRSAVRSSVYKGQGWRRLGQALIQRWVWLIRPFPAVKRWSQDNQAVRAVVSFIVTEASAGYVMSPEERHVLKAEGLNLVHR